MSESVSTPSRDHDEVRHGEALSRPSQLWSDRRVQLYQSAGVISLMYLGYPIYLLIHQRGLAISLLPALVGTALFGSAYAWLVVGLADMGTTGRRSHRHGLVIAVMTLTVALLCLAYGSMWLGGFVFTAVAAGFTERPKEAFREAAGVITVMIVVATGMRTSSSTDLWLIFEAALLFIAMRFCAELMTTIRELNEAREEIARLAIAQERLRFARDLHDLLGHSLSVITLKSELAGKLALVAPERAAAEIADVEHVAREALQEVRGAVSGYRQPRLHIELARARSALSAAGVACSIERAIDTLPESDDTTLGWLVREGVTNVIRHSGARRCSIQLSQTAGSSSLSIDDDGPCRNQMPDWNGDAWGNGLSGLAERIAQRGGRFEAGPRPGGGFHLAASLPCRAEIEEAAGEREAVAS